MDRKKMTTMKILYLSSTSTGTQSSSLYYDLMQEFVSHGADVYCMYAQEKRDQLPTRTFTQDDIHYVAVKTGNITKNSNLFSKGIATLNIDRQFMRAIKQYISDVEFDLVLYSTPPITFVKTLSYFKNRKMPIYLMLKDIFPQNAIDLGMMKQGGMIHSFFRKKEIFNYEIADYIGVMSPANYDYIASRYPWTTSKMTILPNAVKVSTSNAPLHTKSHYGLPEDKVLFLYGGNIGEPQSPEFIMECISAFETVDDALFVICGWGSETHRIINYISENNIQNTVYLGHKNVDVYNDITRHCDVGLIFLDYRFTIPNFPQRILSYMNESKPVICATDTATDMGRIAQSEGFGLSVDSNNVNEWFDAVHTMLDKNTRETMGKVAFDYLKSHYDVAIAYNVIMEQVKGYDDEK